MSTTPHTLPPVTPDFEAFLRCLRRQGTPGRVHHIELFLDPEVQAAVAERFGLREGLAADDPIGNEKLAVRLQRFLGYDYVRCGVENLPFPLRHHKTEDTAALARNGGRGFVDNCSGPITNWAEFERYPWPDPGKITTQALEWYEKNLPDDMCLIGSGGFAHFAEYLTWLMGYETLCVALYEQRDLVQAIADRLLAIYRPVCAVMLEFSRVKVLWGSDDMGHKTGPMIGPDDLRAFVLPGHKAMAAMAHAAGRPYLLHSCGRLDSIMEDLITDVGIDAKHSFEDVIEDVRAAKRSYGSRIALLGGLDLDFLCRATPDAIRRRVRETLDACHSGGGYCLGTGNSVANYLPLDSYLTMLDAGRHYPAA